MGWGGAVCSSFALLVDLFLTDFEWTHFVLIASFRFHKLIKALVVNEDAQIHCLKVVNEFWASHPQVGLSGRFTV